MSRHALLVVVLLLTGCTRWRTAPTAEIALTCWWLDVVLEEGAGASTEDGLDLAGLSTALTGLSVPVTEASSGWAANLGIEQLRIIDEASIALVERRLPPSRDVSTQVAGTQCLEGTLVQGWVEVVAAVEHPELGPLSVTGTAMLEGSGTEPAAASLMLDTGWTRWADVPAPWRAVLAPDYPGETDAHHVAAWLAVGGSLADGALEMWLTDLDGWGEPIDPFVAVRLEWP